MYSNCVKRVKLASLLALGLNTTAPAADVKFFTIGTGGNAYIYYPIGKLIANAISNPPGSRPCDQGGACGVKGLIASAISSRASVANINAIKSGLQNSGFSASNIAYYAYSGTGSMQGKEPMKDLRTIASLYPEYMHIVTLAKSGINSIADLRSKRVSIDLAGSGTYVNAVLILNAFGLTLKDVDDLGIREEEAFDALRNGKIDALFIAVGYPTDIIADLASQMDIKLLPVEGPNANKLIEQYSFLLLCEIPEGIYKGVNATKTITTETQWLTSLREPETLIYEITKALWNKNTRKLLDNAHVIGKEITLQSALDGISVPLHPGAEKFYKEAGLIK